MHGEPGRFVDDQIIFGFGQHAQKPGFFGQFFARGGQGRHLVAGFKAKSGPGRLSVHVRFIPFNGMGDRRAGNAKLLG